jgi:hypothetical protein
MDSDVSVVGVWMSGPDSICMVGVSGCIYA